MVKGTHRGSVKDGGAVQLLGGAETSRRATAPRRQQPPHGVGKRWRQSPSALARFLAKKGKHARREAGLPRARKCNKLGSDILTLDKLRHITNNFSDDQLIGEGAFGKVYKGVLTNGDMIAVKRFAWTITGLHDAQYENEARHLMRLKHQNIVQLVGYYSGKEIKLVRHNGTFVRAEQPERLLCLEYMPKGSLRDHLSDETCGLDWNTRYKIIQGICYGLHYLHEWWQATPIIHMDLKPANILLDDNMVPKVADFGLSRLFGEEQTRTCTTNPKGTPGHMPPEYLEKGVITKTFDIFSLGVIIIEIITGRKDYPTDETETASQQYIDLVLNNWRHRLTKAQGDTSQDNYYQKIKKCIQIALLCVKSDRVKRPTINQILDMLERSDGAYHNKKEKILDIEQILREAQDRWLRPTEICQILSIYKNFRIAPEPPNRPTSGTMFLFDRKIERYFRKDGHNWRKKKDGKAVSEAHEKLKVGSVDVLHGYYARGEENENFQRRIYWLLEEDFMHIVLVHYLENPGCQTKFQSC